MSAITYRVNNLENPESLRFIGTAKFKAALRESPEDDKEYIVFLGGNWSYARPSHECPHEFDIKVRGLSWPEIRLGKYTHSTKGGEYLVLGLAKLWQKEGWFVLYVGVEEGRVQMYLRELSNFREKFEQIY